MPQQSGTEFFTMFGTMMDNKPLSPSSAEPEPPLAADDAKSAASSFSPASLPSSPPPSLATTGARRKSTLRDFFVGPDGIYAIPRWLIYLAIAFVIFQMEVWLLARRAFGRNFWVGTLWGIVSLSVLMLALRIAGAFEFGVLELHGARIWKFALYYAVLFLLTAFFEDFLMRGYSQWVLSRGMNFWPAAALLSFAFGYIHAGNPGEAKTGLVAAGLIGFLLCLTLRRTGDLWWAVGFHMAWDWGESFLYSVPDSGQVLPGHLLNSNLHGPDWLTGGSVGPEGSYLVFVAIGALWVLFDRAYPEVKYGANGVTRTLSSS